jgi:hypothetical protein
MRAVEPNAVWYLEQEASSLLSRLGRVKPFVLQETMLPAAAPVPAAMIAIERLLVGGRLKLREEVRGYLGWLRREGTAAGAAEMQRRFTIVRMRFNDALSQFDLFSEVITQRSEHETGVWLSGLDVLAADALSIPDPPYETPQVLCYLARGPGAAVRRARTRLPGGGENPVAIVRVPRERMVGHGIGSSLVHEVGHQAAALLDLAPMLRIVLRERGGRRPPLEREVWRLWERWISEIVADLWSVGKLGIGSTLGLIGVLSLPRWAMFRIGADDPHPAPWIRVRLSCAMGEQLYPDPQWAQLAQLWEALYPITRLDRETGSRLQALDATVAELACLLAAHRPQSLGGRSLCEVLPVGERQPAELIAHQRRWQVRRELIREAAPTLVFAVLGQARMLGELTAQDESRTVSDLLTYWALRSTLDIAEICATPAPPPARRRRPGVQPTPALSS